MTTNETKTEPQVQCALWNEPPKLSVRTANGVVDVRMDDLTLTSFRCGDHAARNMAIVSLTDGEAFTDAEIAEAFGLTPGRVSQLRARYRDGGAALLLAPVGGVPGPRALSAHEVERVRTLRREGHTISAIVSLLSRPDRLVSHSTVGRIVKGIKREVSGELPLAAPSVASSSVAVPKDAAPPLAAVVEPSVATPLAAVPVPESDLASLATEQPGDVAAPRQCTVAGAMVAHVALERLGFRAALESSGARIGPSLTFDLLRTAAVLVFGVLLRYRSIEAMKHLIRGDFGALLGIRRAPEVRTIHRKLDEIADPASGFDGAAFMRALASGVLATAPAPDGVFFFDDHFKPYHGKRPLSKGWDAKRRIGAPGIEDVYVHDTKGRALLFVPLDAPTSLSCAMPKALAELRKVAGAVPTLAVFDRGGFSRELFRSLVHPTDGTPRLDFLTYLRERKNRRELPESRFRKVSFEDGKRTIELELAESTLEMKGFARPLRLIVLLDRKKGKQIPIITSDETTPAAKLVHLLRARWRQENSFKYLVGELAIDALISNDMTIVPDARKVDNPERSALKEKLFEAKKELAVLDKKLAAAVVENDERTRPTVRGLKISQADVTYPRRYALERIEALKEDIQRLPAKVSRMTLEPGATLARPKTARRIFVNGLKLLVHNAEKWLADRMGDGPYRSHALTILRALCDQPGTIRVGMDRVHVEVEALDTPRYQRCVERLFAALNAERATMLDSGLPIEFSLAAAGGGPNRSEMS